MCWWMPEVESEILLDRKSRRRGFIEEEDVEMRSWDAIRAHKFCVRKVNVLFRSRELRQHQTTLLASR